MILYRRLNIIQERAAEANKTALEAEKARDEIQNEIEQIEQGLYPKRARFMMILVMLMKCSQKLIIGI